MINTKPARKTKARNQRLLIIAMPIMAGPLCALAGINAAHAGTCPAFGSATDCDTIITITQTGATVTSTGQPPYDGIDDTLVGVVNNSKIPLTSLNLSSSLYVFGFDGDGVNTFGAPGNTQDNTGYGGPNTYFTNYGSGYSGTVNFITPIAPGKIGYFSLENALGSAVSCSSIINNSIAVTQSGTNIDATFTPKLGYSLLQAAALCGFTNFDWLQTITQVFNPYPFIARNTGGAFNPGVAGPVQLMSTSTPFSDPPQGGGYIAPTGPYATPDYSFPYYYDASTNGGAELLSHEAGGVTLTFHDRPSNSCMQGGANINTPHCMNAAEPVGAATNFITHLAGIKPDGTFIDLAIGFTWHSTYNGNGSGGAVIDTTKTGLTGPTSIKAVTVDSTNETTSYNYSGFSVTGINGASTQAVALTGQQIQLQARGPVGPGGQLAPSRLLVIRNVSNVPIAGPIQVVFSSLTPGVTLVGADGQFGGFPYVTFASGAQPGQLLAKQINFSSPTPVNITFNLVGYSGTLQ